MYTDYESLYYNSLYHSGVKGMKLGVRKRAAEYAKSIGQQLGYGGAKLAKNLIKIAALNYIEYKNKTPKAVKDLHIERITQMALPPAR